MQKPYSVSVEGSLGRFSFAHQRAAALRSVPTPFDKGWATARQRLFGFNMADTTFIYALVDPRTNTVRYVGKADNPKKRLGCHMRERKNNHRVHWLQQLASLGMRPELVVLEEVEQANWKEEEQKWIRYYRKNGAHLVNGTDGGEGSVGYKHSPDTLEKLKAVQRKLRTWAGRKHTEETRQKMSLSAMGNKRTLGYKPTEETRKKLRRKQSAETRQKRSAALIGNKRWLGKKHTEETKAKIRAARALQVVSDETRRKISESKKGKPWSEARRKASQK